MADILSPEEWLKTQSKQAKEQKILSPEEWLASQKEGPTQLSDEDTSSDLFRGFKNVLPQIQETLGGAKVLAGKALGSKTLMESGVESMKAAESKMVTRKSDEFTEAWEKGIGTVLTDWLPYQIGAGAGNLLETLGFVGLGAAGGAGVPGAVAGAVGKAVLKKEIRDKAQEILKDQGKEAAQKYIQKEAKKALVGLGTTAGLATQAGLHGAGEVTSRAVQEATERGGGVDDIDMGKVAPAAAVHAVADFIANKIMLGAIKPLKPIDNKKVGNLATEIAKRIGVTGLKEIPAEEIQTMAERYGAELSLADAEAMKEYINTAAASMAMSVVPGGVGGVRTWAQGTRDQQTVDKQQDTQDRSGFTGTEETVKDPAGEVDAKTEALLKPVIGPDGQPLAATATSVQAPGQSTAAAPATVIDEEDPEIALLKKEYNDRQLKIDNGTHPNIAAARRKNAELLQKIEAKKAKLATKKSVLASYKDTKEDIPVFTDEELAEGQPLAAAPTQPPATPRFVNALWVTPDGKKTPVKLDSTVNPQFVDGEYKLQAYDENGQAFLIPQMQAFRISAGAETTTDIPQPPAATSTQPPAATEERPPEARPNPLAPNDPNSYQDSAGHIHYKVDAPLANGKSRVTELIDQEQAQNIALKFTDSKGNPNRTLSVGFDNAGKPYWSAKDSSEETIRKNLGENLYNALGNEPITNTEQYQALVQRIKTALEQPPVVTSAQSPAPTPAPKTTLKDIKGREIKFDEDGETRTPDQISGLSFLEQPSYHSRTEPPADVNEGIKSAAVEQAYDVFDTVDIKEGVQPELDRLFKERKPSNPKATKGDPLSYMTEQEILDLYRKHADKREFDRDQDARQAYAGVRNSFVEGLNPNQRAIFDFLYNKALLNEILANRRRGQKRTRKGYSRQEILGEARRETVADLEGQLAEETKTDEQVAAEEATIEQAAIQGIEASTEKRAAKAAAEEKRKPPERRKLLTNIEYEISESAGQPSNVLDVLAAISEDKVNDSITRVIARGLAKIIKDLGLVDQLGAKISFGEVKGKNDGMFDPATNNIVIKGKDGKYTGTRKIDQVMLHEIMHYLTDHVIGNRKAYLASIANLQQRKEVEAALNRLDNNYRLVKAKFGKKYNIGSMKEFIAEMYSNPSLQIDVAGMPSDQPRVSLFRRIVDNIAQALGLRGDTEAVGFKQILDDIAAIISLPTAEIRGKSVSYSEAPKQPKKAEEAKFRENDLYNFEGYQLTPEQKPKTLRYFKNFFTGVPAWRAVATKFQNDRYPIKRWEDVLDLAGKIYYEGKDLINNIYTQITLSTGRAKNYYNEKVKPAHEKLDKDIGILAKDSNMSSEDTLSFLHLLLEALHEPERRMVKYLFTVPLSESPTLNNGTLSPADRRAQIVKLLDTKALTKSQALQLRTELEAMVKAKKPDGTFMYVDPLGNSPRMIVGKNGVRTPLPTDIENSQYNVIGIEQATIATRLQQYKDHPQREQIDRVLQDLKDLNDITAELSKEANYWSDFVTNRVNFYNYQNYAPFKGKSSFDQHSEIDELLDFDATRMGRDLQDVAFSFDGRMTVSDNPVLQTVSDAIRSAMRAGRKELTLSIKNAINQGLIKGRVKETIPFEERDSDRLKAAKGETTIFHYNENGSIDVLVIEDPKLLNAIRRTYKDTNPFTEMANQVTSFLGKMHTRWNYNFAPLNFVRDVITNAWAIGADMGPREALRFASAVASKVVMQNGMYKAMKVAAMYGEGDLPKLRELAKKDPAIRDMVEFIEEGGLVSYLQGLSLKSNFQELQKEIGRSGVMKNVAQLNKFLDIWVEMFELASRSAAYSVAKKNALGKNKSEAEARVRAATYAKNLANFEQVGEWGKTMGAFFMFFRPAATGAVRAIESAAPAFRNLDDVVAELPDTIKGDPQALAKFTEEYAFKQKNARIMIAALMGLGMVAYSMAAMMAPDDDLGRNKVLNDNPEQWTRFARFHIPKELFGGEEDQVFQIPWGFGLGAFAAAGAQLTSVAMGKTSVSDALANIFLQISLDSFVPIPVSRMKPADDPLAFFVDSITPSAARPLVEFLINKNGLGQDIYNDANRRMGDAYLGGDKIPEVWKDFSAFLAESTLGGIDVNPNSLYFLTNSYIDGVSRIFELGYGISDLTQGRKEFNPKTDVPLFGSFFGASSSVDTREFAKVEKEIKEKERRLNMFERNPEIYAEYISTYPFDLALVDIYNKNVGDGLKELRMEANRIRLDRNLTPADRTAFLKINKFQQDLIKRNMLNTFEAYDLKP